MKLEPVSGRKAYCIYVNTLCQGPVPLIRGGDGHYVTFETELEAQREIVDNQISRLQQFLEGGRDYDDAITIEEYIVPVAVQPDGVITDEQGNRFDPKVD